MKERGSPPKQMPDPARKLPVDLRSLARSYTEIAIRTLGGIASNGESDAVKVSACIALLDRGWGKPKEDKKLEVAGEVRVILRQMLEDESEDE